MQIEMMKSKIGHATVTEAELLYEGSITVDKDLAEAVDILENEKVEVLNINNGNRFTTYVIKGEAGSGKICLNGPAARQGLVGDRVMILSYALIEKEKAESFKPKIIHLDNDNKIKS
ncbi:MAG: aspartate 1-decarboxylase [Candidatus Omnitrophica bacterium]|nr:aspartate 1-decarboxylase [Candidatus Omnitrophota bacterium]MBU4333722.1 aspartate 1-decarboxylase [Candidatus Omnitrophota bacterium]